MVPERVIHGQSHKPPEQKIVVRLLHHCNSYRELHCDGLIEYQSFVRTPVFDRVMCYPSKVAKYASAAVGFPQASRVGRRERSRTRDAIQIAQSWLSPWQGWSDADRMRLRCSRIL